LSDLYLILSSYKYIPLQSHALCTLGEHAWAFWSERLEKGIDGKKRERRTSVLDRRKSMAFVSRRIKSRKLRPRKSKLQRKRLRRELSEMRSWIDLPSNNLPLKLGFLLAAARLHHEISNARFNKGLTNIKGDYASFGLGP